MEAINQSLIYAISVGDLDEVRFLTKDFAPVDYPLEVDYLGDHLLIHAVKSRSVEVVYYLLEKGLIAYINKANAHGETALMYAAKTSDIIVHRLIADGADVNLKDKDGNTALFRARNNASIFRQIVEAGADIEIGDQQWHTIFPVGIPGAFFMIMMQRNQRRELQR